MLKVTASGTPHQIGFKHGSEARIQVSRSIKFYADLFLKTANLQWTQVQELASKFEPIMSKKWPAYLDEMAGLAEGAKVELADIIAINVRTEIAFGLFSDGCTALSWKTADTSFLGQNWDWQHEQKENLILLTIEQQHKPTIKMVTEAGIIGKIGINSSGVGVCLNAIRAKGMDETRLSCHLGLRMVLESTSREEAVRRLETYGVASSCHFLVADATGGVGLEFSAVDLQKIQMNGSGQVFHANHYLVEHKGVVDTNWLPCSSARVDRIEELAGNVKHAVTTDVIEDFFIDETGYPGSICRGQKEGTTVETLFNIVMDCAKKTAVVKLGRPIAPEEVVNLSF
ncbi:Hypothetical protein R9X50_00660900 [Acrodontium crateriforme]|uniref:Peptidase C45 hydrolase domain-containing protein n=1 Tax=Acrodontium crateriforme TaxID=150365 RepID=A0AAQ3R6X5_9PEZI|nr:Hypothetical protein R9X50_00660900 [Acrodontium crateriforme]